MPRKRKPSRAQLRANRLNAQKSTGPRTPEGKRKSALNSLKSTGPRTAKGKARSAFNALKHGLWSGPSELKACLGCRRRCDHSWPPPECLERARQEGRMPDDMD